MTTDRLGTVVFAHDHQFYRDPGGVVFTRGGQYGRDLWQRYLEHCAELVVAARQLPLGPSERLDQLTPSSAEGVSFVELPSLSGAVNRLQYKTKARRLLGDRLRAADLLIARLPSQIGLLAIELAERLGTPWVVECVGCTWDAHRNHGSLQASLYAPLAYWEMRAAIRTARVALYVTEHFLQRRYPTRGSSVACSDVAIEDYTPDTLQRRLEGIQQRTGSGKPLRFGLIGSLERRYKGVDVALRALSAAQSHTQALELHVLGAGDAKPCLDLAMRLGVAKAFKVCAPLPAGDAVRKWLDEVDIYLQPSRQEGLPRALLEAMSRGCPALGSRAGGIPELLPDRCLHDVADHGQLARQMLEATEPSWQRQHAQQNHETTAGFLPAALSEQRAIFWRYIHQMLQSTRVSASG